MEEIKAGNIMIDNWFSYTNENGIFNLQVEEIRPTGIIVTWNGGFWFVSYDKLKPIPLTGDILLNAGANRLEENKVAIMLNGPATHLILMKVGTHWYPQIEQIGESVSDGVNTVHLNFIDYAHQAQILFKSLTGNDLKIEV